MIEAYITNLGRYNEGVLDGEFLKFPATTEQVQALLKRIHVDGVRYEEFFITDFETEIDGLCKYMGEYESIDELNYLATLLEELDESELQQFIGALEFGEDTGSVKALINLTQNLDCYDFIPGIEDEDDLGRYYLDDLTGVPEHLQNYIDYEAYGRDIDLNGNGRFVDGGYIEKIDDRFTEHYNGRDDLPDECKIFKYPEPEKSILKTLKNYKQMISETAYISPERSRPVNAEL